MTWLSHKLLGLEYYLSTEQLGLDLCLSKFGTEISRGTRGRGRGSQGYRIKMSQLLGALILYSEVMLNSIFLIHRKMDMQ